MTDESPDTEEQLTSQDFIKEGPIERGLQSHAEAFMTELTLGMHPEDARAVMTKLGARADMFKAMAFEADKEAKRLQARVTELELLNHGWVARLGESEAKRARGLEREKEFTEAIGKYRAALLDIEGRAQMCSETQWAVGSGSDPMYLAMLAILAVVKRVK